MPSAASNKKIRLLLIDDHFVVRVGLAQSLNAEPDLNVVADGSTGEQAVELYRQHKPDVAILDFRLPGMDGVLAGAQIRSEFPHARMIMLTVFEGEEAVHRAVKAGFSAYLPKAADRPVLLQAIRTVASGGTFFPPEVLSKLRRRSERPELTPREMEVLRLIVRGRSNKEIADDLKISEPTVKLHVGNMLDKLGVADRTQAATAAIERGIVFLDEERARAASSAGA